MKTITVKVDIEIPDGATHFAGTPVYVNEHCNFYKMKMIAGQEHWFRWNHDKEDWILHNHKTDAPFQSMTIESIDYTDK